LEEVSYLIVATTQDSAWNNVITMLNWVKIVWKKDTIFQIIEEAALVLD
jgi:hypothetical protein